jgi:hypothetical protein
MANGPTGWIIRLDISQEKTKRHRRCHVAPMSKQHAQPNGHGRPHYMSLKPVNRSLYLDIYHNTTVGHGGVQRTMRNLKENNTSMAWYARKCGRNIHQTALVASIFGLSTSTYRYYFTWTETEDVSIDFMGPFLTRTYRLWSTPLLGLSNQSYNYLLPAPQQWKTPDVTVNPLYDPWRLNSVSRIDPTSLWKSVGTTHDKILPYSSENSIVERVH